MKPLTIGLFALGVLSAGLIVYVTLDTMYRLGQISCLVGVGQ